MNGSSLFRPIHQDRLSTQWHIVGLLQALVKPHACDLFLVFPSENLRHAFSNKAIQLLHMNLLVGIYRPEFLT